MGIEQELPKLRKEFSDEVKNNSKLLSQNIINNSEIDELYRNFLINKFGEEWINNDYKIFFNDEFFIQREMDKLGYSKIDSLDHGVFYSKRQDSCF